MIELDIQPYCQDCPHFSAVVSTGITTDIHTNKSRPYTAIRCEYRLRCAEIFKHMTEFNKEFRGGENG